MPDSPHTNLPSAPPATASLVRGAGREAQVVAFEVEAVAFFVEAAQMLGIPKSVAAIYGICFASPEPLGFSEIDERLDMSSGSISQGLRVLREVGALKVRSTPADRRERFEPDLELRKVVADFMERRVEKQLVAGNTRLKALARSLPPGRSTDAKVLRDRLNALRYWHSKGLALLPVAKTFLKLA